MKRPAVRVVAILFSLAIVTHASAVEVAPATEELARALALAAATQDLSVESAAVIITSEGTIQPWGIKPGFFVGSYATSAGSKTAEWVDLSSLAVYDRAQFWAATEDARAKLGKFSPDVRQMLDELDADESATVAVTFVSDWQDAAIELLHAAEPDVRLSDGRPDTGDDKLNQEVANQMRGYRKAELAIDRAGPMALIKNLGLTVEYAGDFVPMIWVTGTREQVEELTSSTLIVNTMASYKTELSSWSDVYDNIQAGDAFAAGHKGGGATVAVVEYNNVKWDIPTLDDIPAGDYDNIVQGGGSPHNDGHPTWVMAAIANRTSGLKGVAPRSFFISSSTNGSTSFGCQSCDYNIIAAVERAVDHSPSADVINLSIVADSGQNGASGDGAQSMKAYLDNLVGAENIHVAASGGDDFVGFRQCSNTNSPKRVQVPGSAWNVLSAGITDINGSGWADDEIFFESPSDGDPGFCYGDPPGNSGDPITRVKPDIAAPGYQAGFPDSYLQGYSAGTSITSPQIAGTMAVLIGENPTALRAWPEVVRAVIVASSDVHQTSQSHDENEYEGWGTLSVKWATRIVEREVGRGDFGRRQFVATGQYPHFGIPNSLYQNLRADYNRARFVITWNSHGIYSGTGCDDPSTCSDIRMTDFDIHVTNAATGAFVKDCAYEASNYEVCSWASTPGTTYHIVMDPVEWNRLQPAETVGWAFMSHNDQ